MLNVIELIVRMISSHIKVFIEIKVKLQNI
jgi:hypothetical protein